MRKTLRQAFGFQPSDIMFMQMIKKKSCLFSSASFVISEAKLPRSKPQNIINLNNIYIIYFPFIYNRLQIFCVCSKLYTGIFKIILSIVSCTGTEKTILSGKKSAKKSQQRWAKIVILYKNQHSNVVKVVVILKVYFIFGLRGKCIISAEYNGSIVGLHSFCFCYLKSVELRAAFDPNKTHNYGCNQILNVLI